jgi:hypothetical protein
MQLLCFAPCIMGTSRPNRSSRFGSWLTKLEKKVECQFIRSTCSVKLHTAPSSFQIYRHWQTTNLSGRLCSSACMGTASGFGSLKRILVVLCYQIVVHRRQLGDVLQVSNLRRRRNWRRILQMPWQFRWWSYFLQQMINSDGGIPWMRSCWKNTWPTAMALRILPCSHTRYPAKISHRRCKSGE